MENAYKQIIVDNNTCFYQLFWYLNGFKKTKHFCILMRVRAIIYIFGKLIPTMEIIKSVLY